MSRFILAFSSFFRLLFGGKLHPRAVDYLPEGALPALPSLEWLALNCDVQLLCRLLPLLPNLDRLSWGELKGDEGVRKL